MNISTLYQSCFPPLRVLDLFSGIGGFSLGLESTGAYETVAFCEIEEFPRKVLKKHWPHLPIHEDIHHVSGYQYRGIDLVVGGFPCQPISVAGKGKGKEDERWLWPQFFRVIREARPRWCIIENVPRLRTLHGDEVLGDLEECGYTCWPLVVGAGAAGASHKRKRVWVVAHAQHSEGRQKRGACDGLEGQDGIPQWKKGTGRPGVNGEDGVVAHASGERRQQVTGSTLGHESENERWAEEDDHQPPSLGQSWGVAGANWAWSRAPEPVLRGVDDGLPCGVDRRERLKALGNSVVPQVVSALGRAIWLMDL